MKVSLIVHLTLIQVFIFHRQVLSLQKNLQEDNCLIGIPQSYDRLQTPKIEGEPANVFMQIEVLDLDEINEENMDFRLHAYINAMWDDARISVNSSNMNEDCMKHIWIPDLNFEESKSLFDTGQYSTYLVATEGLIYLSKRYAFKATCMMDFHRYPFDVQHCIFTISFMRSHTNEAVLKWFDHPTSPFKKKAQAIDFTKKIDPLQFTITESPPTKYFEKQFLFANFSYLAADFVLTRRITGSVVNHYMPSALLVFISWITFWFQEDAAAERVTLIMTALLTLCYQGQHYKSELPPVNYITAMDIWFFVCISMIFATLLQFSFVYNAYTKAKEKKDREQKNSVGNSVCSECPELKMKEDSKFPVEFSERIPSDEDILDNQTIEHINSNSQNEMKLDSVCKIAFPGFFFLFTAIYWANYCEIIPIW